MYLHTGSMELESNSSIDGNAAGDDGGGLSAWKSTLTASNISIDGNAAGNIGGGVYALSCSSITLSQGASANSNTAEDRAGGLYVQASTLTASSSSIDGNAAGATGGGVYAISL